MELVAARRSVPGRAATRQFEADGTGDYADDRQAAVHGRTAA